MIQTEPDHGVPQSRYSEGTIGDWSVIIRGTASAHQAGISEHWGWEATRNDGTMSWRLESQNMWLTSYEAAKSHCMSAIESLTPNGFLPKSYVSAEDASHEIRRLENGRWVCSRGYAVGKHNFATAGLAAAAHEFESFGDKAVTRTEAIARILADLDQLESYQVFESYLDIKRAAATEPEVPARTIADLHELSIGTADTP